MSAFPSFVFVDADGRVAYRNSGALGAENFHAIVEQLTP
jgi:thioredoxin-related protein